MKRLSGIAFAFLITTSFSARACSCPPERVPEAFRDASMVFVGRVLRVHLEPQSRFRADLKKSNYVETATLLVEKSWKGPKAGGVVKLRSNIGIGLCGLSCVNNPATIREEDVKTHRLVSARISSEWLVYAYGKEPVELSICSRSLPLMPKTSNDIPELNALRKKIGLSR